MGTRALEFSRAHSDADAGYGIVDVRAASARKAELGRNGELGCGG